MYRKLIQQVDICTTKTWAFLLRGHFFQTPACVASLSKGPKLNINCWKWLQTKYPCNSNFRRLKITHLIVIYKALFDRLSIVFVVFVFVRNLFVIKKEFSDLDVGTVSRVHLSASRKIQGNNEWTLKKVLFSSRKLQCCICPC